MQTQSVVVKTYKGSQSAATSEFQRDADRMAKLGYFPTSQNYAQGAYGCWAFLGALILCFIIIGVVVFIYMLIVKPDGTLSVTYELRKPTIDQNANLKLAEKQCPRCAETVKDEAKVCRFCGHNFEIS